MTEEQQYKEDHGIVPGDIELSNLNADKVSCSGCCTLTEEPYICALCKKSFCVEHDCLEVNYMDSGIDLCLNCLEDRDWIISQLVAACKRLADQVEYLEKE
jgi:hypothetical protein